MKHEVKWKERTFQMSALTRGQKKEFCEWLIARRREEIIQDLRGFPDVMNLQLDGLRSRIWWSAKGMSPAVFDSIRSPEGGHKYIRMLMGVTPAQLSDDDLTALIDEKEREQQESDDRFEREGKQPPYPPVNDYCMAFQAIHEEMDPKANGPESGSAPTPTP